MKLISTPEIGVLVPRAVRVREIVAIPKKLEVLVVDDQEDPKLSASQLNVLRALGPVAWWLYRARKRAAKAKAVGSPGTELEFAL